MSRHNPDMDGAEAARVTLSHLNDGLCRELARLEFLASGGHPIASIRMRARLAAKMLHAIARIVEAMQRDAGLAPNWKPLGEVLPEGLLKRLFAIFGVDSK